MCRSISLIGLLVSFGSSNGINTRLSIMKTIRNTIASESDANPRRNGAAKAIPVINSAGPSFSDLPNNILVTILLRLPVKRIFVCKCVCKPWYDVISDPEFAKLHFNQAQVYPLLRSSRFTSLSRMLYLVQPEQDDIERNLDTCYDYRSPTKIELDSKLKLPLRNIQMILDREGVESKDCLNLMDMENKKYKIVNSCNGLLCLSNQCDNEPVIVCNPVTGEFINLPNFMKRDDDDDYIIGSRTIMCGFGFCPSTNQYKVMRMFTGCIGELDKVIVAEVHILGTETWRVLPSFPKSTFVFFPTYLNGCVYWLSNDDPCSVICFDIEKECFESITVPPILPRDVSKLSMGVLGGELFISAFQLLDIRFWVMKDNGSKSWSLIYSFQVYNDEKWPYGSYQPIKYLNNGELLMFQSYEQALICKDPRKNGFRFLKIHGFNSGSVEAIPHIPSFVPLKHALSGHDVTVLNVKSRCADLELHEEGQGISLIEEMYREPFYDLDYWEYMYEEFEYDYDLEY